MSDAPVRRARRGEMHDRINRVIQGRVPNLGGVDLVSLVDAILTAMREPTETMTRTAEAKYDESFPKDQPLADVIWAHMIDAALAEDCR